MGMHPDQREAIVKRIEQLRLLLSDREAVGDLEGWKKLPKEKLDLQRRLKGNPPGK